MNREHRQRIAYVVHSLEPGGTERLAVELAKSISRNHDVEVICLDEPGEWAEDLRQERIPVRCAWRAPGFDATVSLALANFFRAFGADVIHAHQCTPWIYSALARFFYRKPRLLLEEHGRFYPEVKSTKRRLVNRLLTVPMTDRIYAVSADVRDRLVQYEGIPAERIGVIYNGTTPAERLSAEDRRCIRAEFGYTDRDFVIGTIGRLDPIKNIPMLLKALGPVTESRSEVKCLVVGDGPERDRLKAIADTHRLLDNVTFTGYRSDSRRLTAALDLFVMTSLSEGTSIALLEAMSAEIPIIATDVGGNPEVVISGETGVLIPSNDAQSLADNILDLLDNEERRRKIARAARHRFAREFSFSAMVDRYQMVYESMKAARS